MTVYALIDEADNSVVGVYDTRELALRWARDIGMRRRNTRVREATVQTACLNCCDPFDPDELDIHKLCPDCSVLAEASTMSSLRHAAGLE